MRYKVKSFLHPNTHQFCWYIIDVKGKHTFTCDDLFVEPSGPYMFIPKYLYGDEKVAIDTAHRMNLAFKEEM